MSQIKPAVKGMDNKKITQEELGSYCEKGFHPCENIFNKEEVQGCREEIQRFESSLGMKFSDRNNFFKHKAHLLFTWMDDMVRNDRLLDVVEGLLGTENILVKATDIFIKEPNDPAFISFHQDATYWGLDSDKVLTAWVAITDSNESNGVMRVIPGSQKLKQLPHTPKPNEHNMLTNYQEVEFDFENSDSVALELEPGEVSFHNYMIVHGSYPNTSDHRRIGVAIRYMSTEVKPAHDKPDYAMLVRGVDEHKNFLSEQPPEKDVDPVSITTLNHFQKVLSAVSAINFADTQLQPEV